MTPTSIKPEHKQHVLRCMQQLRSQRKYRPLQKAERHAIYDLRHECEAAEGDR